MAVPNPAILRALLDDEVEGEALHWEERIYEVLALLALAVVLLVLSLWQKLNPQTAVLNVSVAIAAVVFFGLCSRLVRRGPRAVRTPLRLVSTVFEASLGTLAMYSIAIGQGGAWAQASPALFLYAVAILIAAARMRPLLCIFATGIVIVEYAALYYVVLLPMTSATELAAVPTFQPWAMWNRLFWLLVCGLIAAVTTRKARALMLSTGSAAFERRRIEHEFGRYVSRDVADAILHGKTPLEQAERRAVSVLFCDLRHFTAICERERPEDVVRMLNTFFDRLCTIIVKQGGTVNKFLGDGVLALWGAPVDHAEHVAAAARAAFAILDATDDLRADGGMWEAFDVGIGLDTGDVVVGPIGAPSRVEYTAIGSVVNRAARLQGLARQANQRVIVSRAYADQLGEPERLVSIGKVVLKGFPAAEEAFSLEP